MAKKMTIEDLAIIAAKGFDGVDTKIEDLAKETRTGFDRIENLLLRDHLNRIERLEDTVLQLKVKAGMR